MLINKSLTIPAIWQWSNHGKTWVQFYLSLQALESNWIFVNLDVMRITARINSRILVEFVAQGCNFFLSLQESNDNATKISNKGINSLILVEFEHQGCKYVSVWENQIWFSYPDAKRIIARINSLIFVGLQPWFSWSYLSVPIKVVRTTTHTNIHRDPIKMHPFCLGLYFRN